LAGLAREDAESVGHSTGYERAARSCRKYPA